MPDIIGNGEWGRDDGIKCHECGGETYLTHDQGGGLRSYDCDDCGVVNQVQFDSDEDLEYEPEGWEQAFFDERTSL